MSITVGQVSGIIAAGITSVQLLFPNALVLIISSILGNEHNAVTWSVASRHLLSSYWPSLLGSDTASGSSVNIGVRLLGAIKFIGVLLIAIAAVVTPLGLHEAIVVEDNNVQVPFSDLIDTSPVGIGTPARSSLGFSRSCGNLQPLACPGSKTQVDLEFDPDNSSLVIDSTIIGTYDVHVPEALIELYQSGLSTQPETVSSFFDIHTRQYTEVKDPKKIDGQPYQVDAFRMLDSMVLNDAVEAREGVIVDTQKGRIAFRHHRTPNNVGAGAEWDEDLLFMEPDTQCVDLNVTIEFTIGKDGHLVSDLEDITLIDNGGFSQLVQEFPTMNVTTTQEDPQLRFRAYKAGWLTNTYSMLIMNVTRPNPNSFAYMNSEPGKRFKLESSIGSRYTVNSVASDTSYFSVVDPDVQAKSNYTSTFTNTTTSSGIYDNPFDVTQANYSSIPLLCRGAGGADAANSSNIWIQCGLIYGAARRKDGQDSLIFRPGDVYEQSIYSCASVTKASIKTVSLKYNATEGGNNLKALTIQNITDKVYSDENGPNPPPLWGIETLAMGLVEVQQLWGLISEENKDAPNMTAIRAPHLHLPGFSLGLGMTASLPGYQYIPGNTAPARALVSIYESLSSIHEFDYTGGYNLAMFKKWQTLSKTPEGVSRMLNIVWADQAANYMMGTRGWGTGKNVTASGSGSLRKRQSPGGDETAQQTVMVPVKLYEKKVQYHWLYAIPAFMAMALFLTVLAASCCCTILRGGPKRTKYYLNHLSAGRLLAEQRFPGTVDKQVPTKVWVKAVGKHKVALKDGYGYGPGVAGPAVGGAASPYVGGNAGGGEGYFGEGKQGMNASATELHRLNPVGGQSPIIGQGYIRVQS